MLIIEVDILKDDGEKCAYLKSVNTVFMSEFKKKHIWSIFLEEKGWKMGFQSINQLFSKWRIFWFNDIPSESSKGLINQIQLTESLG